MRTQRHIASRPVGVGILTAAVLLTAGAAGAQAQGVPDRGCDGAARVPAIDYRWEVRNYTWHVNNGSIPAPGVHPNAQRRSARGRMAGMHHAWARTKTGCRRNGRPIRDQSNFTFTSGGFTNARYLSSADANGNGQIDPEEEGRDQLNVIDFGAVLTGCPNGSVACAVSQSEFYDHDNDPNTAPRERYSEADIRFTTDISWWYRASRFVRPGRCVPAVTEVNDCQDLLAFGTHEVGHTLGLLHSCERDEQDECSDANRSQTMNALLWSDYTRAGNFAAQPNARTLGIGDIRRFRAIYPHQP